MSTPMPETTDAGALGAADAGRRRRLLALALLLAAHASAAAQQYPMRRRGRPFLWLLLRAGKYLSSGLMGGLRSD